MSVRIFSRCGLFGKRTKEASGACASCRQLMVLTEGLDIEGLMLFSERTIGKQWLGSFESDQGTRVVAGRHETLDLCELSRLFR